MEETKKKTFGDLNENDVVYCLNVPEHLFGEIVELKIKKIQKYETRCFITVENFYECQLPTNKFVGL